MVKWQAFRAGRSASRVLLSWCLLLVVGAAYAQGEPAIAA
jgi:hypothetical protein